MNWMRLSDSEAKKKIKDYESKPQDQFSEIVQNWKDGKFDLEDPEYSEIRTCICLEYEKYKDVKFGVVAMFNLDGNAKAPDFESKAVYSSELDNIKENDYFEIIVSSISDNSANVENGLESVKNSDKNIIFCLYAKVGEQVFFLDGGVTVQTLTGISYQEILDITKN